MVGGTIDTGGGILLSEASISNRLRIIGFWDEVQEMVCALDLIIFF